MPRCQHDPQVAWGFDLEDGAYRCSECGALIDKPPKWLVVKCEAVVAEWEAKQQLKKTAIQ